MARHEQTYTSQGVPIVRRKQRPRGKDWTCTLCGKLLGRIEHCRVRILVSRSHQYLVSTPVTSVCRSCGKLNELTELL